MTKQHQADQNDIFKNVLFSLGIGFPLGWLFACGYLAVQDGFSVERLNQLTFFEIIENSPIFLGIITPAFQTALMVLFAVPIASASAVAIFMMRPKPYAHGSARWAAKTELIKKGYYKKYKDIIGPIYGKSCRAESTGHYLTNGPQPHTLVSAPTRAGKGVGVVIPTMLTHNGSSIVLDVKGELFDLTSRARIARGDNVFKFCPLDPQGRSHRFNPVDDIAAMPDDRKFIEARRLAASLIISKGKGGEGFIDGARDLFVAGILAVIERGTPTIGAVYDLFSQPGEKFELFARLAGETNSPEARRIFDNMAGNDNKILTSYTSVLGDGGLNLWADQLIKNATSASDFSIHNLRRDPTCIYLVVSPNDIEVLSPLVRLLFQQTVGILQRTMPQEDEIFEVLFLLDEFKHLGKMEAIETAITTIAGYGGRFMFIIQTLSALTQNYEQSGKENFLGNTGLQVFMATADAETPEYISKAIGEYTRHAKSKSYNSYEVMKSNYQEREESIRLIRPEQIRLLNEDKQIVLIKGEAPLLIHKIKYYKDKILKELFEGQEGPLPEPEPIIVEPNLEVGENGAMNNAEQNVQPAASSPDLAAQQAMPDPNRPDPNMVQAHQHQQEQENQNQILGKMEIAQIPAHEIYPDYDETQQNNAAQLSETAPFERKRPSYYHHYQESAQDNEQQETPDYHRAQPHKDIDKNEKANGAQAELLAKIEALQKNRGRG